MNPEFWRGKRVLMTGHTGFKGAWMALWLQKLGARVMGYALPAPMESLFELASVGDQMESAFADIRDAERLEAVVRTFRPEIVFHLAAQSLVRKSYIQPVETYGVNVMGTVNLLQALRYDDWCRVIVNVTSDKCYENQEWTWGYRECDPLGGHDPYSSSKACAEFVTSAYRRSFFEPRDMCTTAVATVRAGNVIGGGDFSVDRIVPDFMAAARTGKTLQIRNPSAVRPWQHVLEPLHGYMLLAERLWMEGSQFAGSWNFGPAADGIRPVQWIVNKLNECSSRPVSWTLDTASKPHEARLLMLDSSKARAMLGWKQRWTLEETLRAVVSWYETSASEPSAREITLQQIAAFQALDDAESGDCVPSAAPPIGEVRRRAMDRTLGLLQSEGVK